MLKERRETPQKIRIGDIVKNLHASDNNPIRKSIIVAKNGELAKFCYISNKNEVSVGYYNLRDLRYDPSFIVVGHVDLNKVITELIKDY